MKKLLIALAFLLLQLKNAHAAEPDPLLPIDNSLPDEKRAENLAKEQEAHKTRMQNNLNNTFEELKKNQTILRTKHSLYKIASIVGKITKVLYNQCIIRISEIISLIAKRSVTKYFGTVSMYYSRTLKNLIFSKITLKTLAERPWRT